MEYLDLADLSHAMATCRALYDLGIPILLQDVQLVRSSCSYYQSRFALYRKHLLKNPTRFAWVRRLSCPAEALDDRIRIFFKSLPRNFTSIRSLKLDMHGTEVDDYLASWILSLENLRSLKILYVRGYSPAQTRLVERMGLKLEELHIGMTSLPPTQSIFHPLQALAGSAITLRSLSIQCVRSYGGPALTPKGGLCFRAVEELAWVSAQNVLVSDLLSTFPAVRKLRIRNPRLEHTYTMVRKEYHEDALLEIRTHNRDVQDCVRMRWARLETLDGDPFTLWVLGLRCRAVQLKTALSCVQLGKPGYTLDVLHDTRPEHLVLALSSRCNPAHLRRILTFPSLRRLTMTFKLTEVWDSVKKVHTLLTEALQQMCRSNIRHLTITVELWLEVYLKSTLKGSQRGVEVKRPQPKRAFPARWLAKIPQILEAFPALVELNIDIWKSHPFVWKLREDTLPLDADDDPGAHSGNHKHPARPRASSPTL
ncbi:hypothetical protein PsYK624_162840 [Phanerochaete sordida]|uniref:F-box domain-containing protein n=1 Tax=Phanerochaete sordida TaxID=48140 RepID=A0A9P3GSH3_9APHY|nr:hypothetical protein PsYK624_162840 [Phanerochaete sordida]